jgi:UDP-2-acetamido-2,6-beta-L-arabino-hexul-4-ose reductase
MNILVTGSKGFLASNLIARLKEKKNINILYFNKSSKKYLLEKYVKISDIIFHLAGQNRSKHKKDFSINNIELTKKICNLIKINKLNTKLIFASSTQVTNNSIYGKSKLEAENCIIDCANKNNSQYFIFRIPNIFGKWCKPNYNSVVATFSYNIARNKKIILKNEKQQISLVHIDDLIDQFLDVLKCKIDKKNKNLKFVKIKKIYKITPDKLSEILHQMKKDHGYFCIKSVNYEFLLKLYSTFLTYFPKNLFSYSLKKNQDDRGNFSEFLKFQNLGQISYFTINKKKSRGGHYHHKKVEKFIFLSGKVKITYLNIINKKKITFTISANENMVVETIPGWAHNIENVSNQVVAGVVWANEIFDSSKPDTYRYVLK